MNRDDPLRHPAMLFGLVALAVLNVGMLGIGLAVAAIDWLNDGPSGYFVLFFGSFALALPTWAPLLVPRALPAMAVASVVIAAPGALLGLYLVATVPTPHPFDHFVMVLGTVVSILAGLAAAIEAWSSWRRLHPP